jgi:hypothetical protein
MYSIARTMTIIAASMLFSAIPVLADEGNMGSTGSQAPQVQQGQKDECLLVAINCGSVPDSMDSIQHRINRLNREIGRGTDVYTPEELQNLREQRNEYNLQILRMESFGGG